MSTDLSREILRQIQLLSSDEQLDVLDQLRVRIESTSVAASRSILDLEGLGAEVWNGIDAQEYVRCERDI